MSSRDRQPASDKGAGRGQQAEPETSDAPGTPGQQDKVSKRRSGRVGRPDRVGRPGQPDQGGQRDDDEYEPL